MKHHANDNRPLVYGSVCSGIEAATVAWHPLGWRPAFFSEIEAFPRAVLTHHYPEVPLHGDFTQIGPEAGPIDLLVGGTPCQSFSVAGKRLGLDDPRGNLALEYLALARRLRARWIVWENVPGVLSSFSGRPDHGGDPRPGDRWDENSDFATFLSFVLECGYGFAYRVLDAQFARVDGYPGAVPQRRNRVILVGYLGDWRRAAAVLFERESLRWDPAPRREAGKRSASPLAACSAGGSGYRNDADTADNLIAGTLGTRSAAHAAGVKSESDSLVPIAFGGGNTSGPVDVAACLTAKGQRVDFEVETFVTAPPLTRNPYGDHESREGLLVAHTLRAEGFDASEDGTGRGTPIVAVPFDTTQITSAGNFSAPKAGDPCHPLAAGAHPPAIAFDARQSDVLVYGDKTGPLDTDAWTIGVQAGWAVRRLTPRECERLQGFPDDYTLVPWRKGMAPDGPRYRALGNSMAVNVMRWVGQRIAMVEAMIPHQEAA